MGARSNVQGASQFRLFARRGSWVVVERSRRVFSGTPPEDLHHPSSRYSSDHPPILSLPVSFCSAASRVPLRPPLLQTRAGPSSQLASISPSPACALTLAVSVWVESPLPHARRPPKPAASLGRTAPRGVHCSPVSVSPLSCGLPAVERCRILCSIADERTTSLLHTPQQNTCLLSPSSPLPVLPRSCVYAIGSVSSLLSVLLVFFPASPPLLPSFGSRGRSTASLARSLLRFPCPSPIYGLSGWSTGTSIKGHIPTTSASKPPPPHRKHLRESRPAGYSLPFPFSLLLPPSLPSGARYPSMPLS